jgi:hypothetical protein
MQDAMLEIEDGHRLRHFHNNTMSESMREVRRDRVRACPLTCCVQGLLLLADVLGVDHATLRLQPTVANTLVDAAASDVTRTDTLDPATTMVATTTRRDAVTLAHAPPLVDERLVNFILERIGDDATRPATWDDRPYSR